MRQSAYGWLGLAAYVAVWDRKICRHGETLSDGAADAFQLYPLLTLSGAIYLIAHLFGWLPPEVDAFHCLRRKTL